MMVEIRRAFEENFGVYGVRVELVDPPCSPRATPTIAVVAAIAHHLRTGGAWRGLPSWFPNWRTT